MGKKEEIPISKDILNYINEQHNKGFKSEQIKAKLLEAGHERDTVEHHIKHFHSKKRASRVILLVLILIIIAVAYAVFMVGTPNDNAKTTTTTTTSQVATSTVEQVYNDISQAVLNKDIEACKALQDPRDVKGCTLEVEYKKSLSKEERDKILLAYNSENKTICDELAQAAKSVCYDSLIVRASNSLEECSTVKSEFWKEFCSSYYMIEAAKNTKDNSYCDKVYLPVRSWKDCGVSI